MTDADDLITECRTAVDRSGRYSRATCSCGWVGPVRDAWLIANGDAGEHLNSEEDG